MTGTPSHFFFRYQSITPCRVAVPHGSSADDIERSVSRALGVPQGCAHPSGCRRQTEPSEICRSFCWIDESGETTTIGPLPASLPSHPQGTMEISFARDYSFSLSRCVGCRSRA